ncbi:GntR family transcriptional regulator [uncultured Sunxiuqinia sp.]|uniref:GntR family transcriptional regulator n=1 Tax=uncultured Sunxiuqinia sp. TaxID=1573825 RepID=UPI0030D96928
MKLTIDHQSPIPLHAQVESLLRQMIELPEYQDGGFLPKEIDLARQLGISRNTLRQATNKLEYEGLLVRKKGVGTIVAKKTVTTHLQHWHSFTQEMNERGVQFKTYSLNIEWVEADEKLASFFKVEEQTRVLRLSRVRGDDAGPFVYFESYFHPRIGLTGNEDFTRPLYEILEDDFHVVPSLSKEKIKARLATSITAKRLSIAAGDPVLVRERLVYDPGDRPLEYNIGFYCADKFAYTIDIKR